MKKFIGLLFVVAFYSTNGYALHAAGVTQHFETGMVESEFTVEGLTFFHFGDSHVDLSLDPFDDKTDTLTIDDFIFLGLQIDSYTWDLSTGSGIDSECVSLNGDCFIVGDNFLLTNISISTFGGSLQNVFNEESGEGGELFFYDDVTVDADILFGQLHITSVPLPGAVIIFSSGLILLAGVARKKRPITG